MIAPCRIDVLASGEIAVEARRDLDERADAAADAAVAARRLVDAREQLERRRLPRAVRPDDAERLAGPHLEREIAHGPEVARLQLGRVVGARPVSRRERGGNQVAQAVVELAAVEFLPDAVEDDAWRRSSLGSRHTTSAKRRSDRWKSSALDDEPADGPGGGVGEVPWLPEEPARRRERAAEADRDGSRRRGAAPRGSARWDSASCSARLRSPNIGASRITGVTKMPKVRKTCTMYFTSRKNRFAQLRKSAAASANDPEEQRAGRAPRAAATERRTPRNGSTHAMSVPPISESKVCASTAESGSTSRGK